MAKKVAVIMGSDSDFDVVSAAIDTLRELGIPVEARILSAHRTPEEARKLARTARGAGFGAIIAAQILSVEDGEIAAKLDEMRREMTREVLEKDRALRERMNREDD